MKSKVCTVHLQKLSPEAIIPSYESEGASGADLYAIEATLIAPGARAIARTGIALALPIGLEAQVRPRSGIALEHGVTVLNAPGTIDQDYRGEIKVILVNHGKRTFHVKRGMRIAQIVFSRVDRVRFELAVRLESTERNNGGFGHSGITSAKSPE